MLPLPSSAPLGRMASGKTRLYKIPLVGRLFSSRHLPVAAIGLSECHRLQQGAKAHCQRPSPSTRQQTWRMGDTSYSSRGHTRGSRERLGARMREEARRELRDTKRTEEQERAVVPTGTTASILVSLARRRNCYLLRATVPSTGN